MGKIIRWKKYSDLQSAFENETYTQGYTSKNDNDDVEFDEDWRILLTLERRANNEINTFLMEGSFEKFLFWLGVGSWFKNILI